MNADVIVRVTGVRSRGSGTNQGAIFTGVPIDDSGKAETAGEYVVVRASGSALAGADVQRGQWWRVYGQAHRRNIVINGFESVERQIEASRASLVRPSGEHVVSFIAESPHFQGIGYAKARRLWHEFGEGLYAILDAANVDAISSVLSDEIARSLVRAWASFGASQTLQWLHAQGFDVSLGRKLIQYFGDDSQRRIEEDPFRLLSFCATWDQVDAMASAKFGVPADDPRRLRGAAEEACYRVFERGSTVVTDVELRTRLISILKSATLARAAERIGYSNGSHVDGPFGIQPVGAMVMESTVAQEIAKRMRGDGHAAVLDERTVSEVIARFERDEGIQLNDEQQAALHSASRFPFVCITGGAGVGKTTVLKALYRVYDDAGYRVVQLALAGRAAKRMQEATARDASTIANFLAKYRDGDLEGSCVLVIDEASMVDIVTMYRICETIPSSVRIVLVGDSAQLMPVGPGLVLHAVMDLPDVPVAKLRVVKRYGDTIASAATMIREGIWPSLCASTSDPISFVECVRSDLSDVVLDLYATRSADTQILSPRRAGPDGTTELNRLAQDRFSRAAEAVRRWNDDSGRWELTGLRVGDPVLCTRNMWDHGLQNGSLGRIVETVDQHESDFSERAAIATVLWDDGVRRSLYADMLEDVTLGYAITVHKAQGSQWPRIIVPVVHNRMLDRTLLYTAITRAQQQVILVGSVAAAAEAVRAPPRAQERRIALNGWLKTYLAS